MTKSDLSYTRLLLASSIHRWNDVRIYHKEAKSLALRYDVTVMGVKSSVDTNRNNISVIELPLPRSIWQRGMNASRILLEGISGGAHVIHFHDPELIWVGLLLKLFRKKVIYDIHEDIQAAIQVREWIPRRIKGIVGYITHLFELLGECVFNGLIVAESSYISMFSKKNQVHVVRNFVRINSEPVTLDPKSKKIFYAGSVTVARGIGDFLESIAILQKEDRSIGATIIGSSPDSDAEFLMRMKNKLPNPDVIELLGFTDFERLYSYVLSCRLAVVPLRRVKNYEWSIPTKILDYMNWGIPFVYSRLKLTEKLFGEGSGGIGFDPENVPQLAQAIRRILINDDLHRQLIKQGRNKIHLFDWKGEEATLLKFYEDMLSSSTV